MDKENRLNIVYTKTNQHYHIQWQYIFHSTKDSIYGQHVLCITSGGRQGPSFPSLSITYFRPAKIFWNRINSQPAIQRPWAQAAHQHQARTHQQLPQLPTAQSTNESMSDQGRYRSDKRGSAESEDGSRKKSKKDGEKYNPYLAHMQQDGDNGNGFNNDEPSLDSPLAGMKRRNTTAKQASKAEDSESNPFTGEPHSQKYFQILETRRNLPVHKQRFVIPQSAPHSTTGHHLGVVVECPSSIYKQAWFS